MIRDWRSDVCSSDLGAMSAPSIFIRLLLSVALILNGSAGAMVAAHAMTDQNGQAGAGGTASGQDENTGQAFAQPSCHHIQSVAAMAAPSSDTTAAAVGDGRRHPSDCCGSADCRSVCAQHCAAAITGTAMVDRKSTRLNSSH